MTRLPTADNRATPDDRTDAPDPSPTNDNDNEPPGNDKRPPARSNAARIPPPIKRQPPATRGAANPRSPDPNRSEITDSSSSDNLAELADGPTLDPRPSPPTERTDDPITERSAPTPQTSNATTTKTAASPRHRACTETLGGPPNSFTEPVAPPEHTDTPGRNTTERIVSTPHTTVTTAPKLRQPDLVAKVSAPSNASRLRARQPTTVGAKRDRCSGRSGQSERLAPTVRSSWCPSGSEKARAQRCQ
jgi:hypothetical protein